jgi:hypothetical protein
MVSEGIASPDYSWTPPQKDQRWTISRLMEMSLWDSANTYLSRTWTQHRDSQEAELRLNTDCSLYSYRAAMGDPVERYLHVSLDGSTFTPAREGMMWDAVKFMRGWFTEFVCIRMQFVDAKPGEILVKKDAPATTSVAGSSSLSSSIDFSVAGGFFGTEATGTGSVGGSISRTFTTSMEDYQVENETSSEYTNHCYRLKMVEGSEYLGPSSLAANAWTGDMPVLPPRATSNLPLPSQALFHVPQPLSETRTLRIEVRVRLALVMGSGPGLHGQGDLVCEQQIPIDFGHVR